MKVRFKITTALLRTIRTDLRRSHAFARERVGFISTGLSACDNDVLVLARQYRPVLDSEYLHDASVGAMMGPDAIRRALQWAMDEDGAMFHVHTHGGRGVPRFSSTDLRENQKFMADFFKVAPRCIHGAIVLSDTAAHGHVWFGPSLSRGTVASFTEVGIPLRRWGPNEQA